MKEPIKEDLPTASQLAATLTQAKARRPAIIGCEVVEVDSSGRVRTLDDDDPAGQPGAKFYPVIGGRAASVGDKGVNIRVGDVTPEQRVVAISSPASDVGDVKWTARATAPTGWLICNGAAVSRTTYANLFAVIGTTYGAGDGSTTFNLPDGRDRALVGVSGTKALGSSGGSATATLTSTELPAHSHNLYVAGGGATHNTVTTAGNQASQEYTDSMTQTGSGAAFSIQNPYLALNMLIRF